jgi:hypothetical protein
MCMKYSDQLCALLSYQRFTSRGKPKVSCLKSAIPEEDKKTSAFDRGSSTSFGVSIDSLYCWSTSNQRDHEDVSSK